MLSSKDDTKKKKERNQKVQVIYFGSWEQITVSNSLSCKSLNYDENFSWKMKVSEISRSVQRPAKCGPVENAPTCSNGPVDVGFTFVALEIHRRSHLWIFFHVNIWIVMENPVQWSNFQHGRTIMIWYAAKTLEIRSIHSNCLHLK